MVYGTRLSAKRSVAMLPALGADDAFALQKPSKRPEPTVNPKPAFGFRV